jgi:glycosyltransferase involved in cell wall biosynthesis
MRTAMPEEIKAKFSRQTGITIYDGIIPWPQLENEFQTADIFLYPTNVTPSNVFLDAMSYELPIVTTDVWGNPEIVADGKTGVLIHHPTADKFTNSFIVHFNSPEFRKAISVPPPGLVESTVEKLIFLIENPELRRRMGKAGRWEIERGDFSIENRNEKLKKILDEATS